MHARMDAHIILHNCRREVKDDFEDVFHLRLQSQGCIFKKKLGGMVPLCIIMHTLVWRSWLFPRVQIVSYARLHMHAQTHTRTETQTHACTDATFKLYREKGNSLSRKIVTSAALFTRLMPCCTQERVNQARGYIHTSPRFIEQIIHSPPRNRNEATPMAAVTHRDEGRPFTRYIGTLYTIRVRMTVA